MKDILFLGDAAGTIVGSVGLMMFGGFCFALACLLFPFVVMSRLGKIIKRLERLRDDQVSCLKEQTEELQRQNALTRQLLRAYGHEPEA